MVALITTIVAAIVGLPATFHEAGPTTTAPFVIKDAAGHVLVDVDVGPGGGQLRRVLDVCVNGPKAQACLSFVAIKTNVGW